MENAYFDLEEIQRNSFKNFHAKGLDYLCLKRSDSLTRKVYFFDGEMHKLPEVVIPHDHRYAFKTTVLTGRVANRTYHVGRCRGAEAFEQFSYMTPLNGGDGFTWDQTAFLKQNSERAYTKGQSYFCPHTDVHTIEIQNDVTVIVLDQFKDEVPLDVPTRAFKRDRITPNLSGLYEKMTGADVLRRMRQVSELMETA